MGGWLEQYLGTDPVAPADNTRTTRSRKRVIAPRDADNQPRPTIGPQVGPVRQMVPARVKAQELNPNNGPAQMRKAVNVASWLPGIGDVIGAFEGGKLAAQGHPVAGAALAASALIPIPGVGKRAARTAFKEVKVEAFDRALKTFAKKRPDERGFITWRTPEQMREEKMRTFLSPDGKTGYAIHPETGDIRNVFNHGTSGRGAEAVASAIASHGGRRLDAFDTNLANFYRDFGFRETNRMKWDDQYRPSVWNENKYGKPDVVEMEFAGAGGDPERILGDYETRRGLRKATGRAVSPTANTEILRVADRLRQPGARQLPRVGAVDKTRASEMAKVYESLPKNDPAAKEAYDALNAEVEQQFKALEDAGYKIEFTDSDPYKSSAEMMEDVQKNRRLKVFKTPQPGTRAYHGTYQTFDEFADPGEGDLGIHLGKSEQAKGRLGDTAKLPKNRDSNPRVLAVEHNIKNPLRLDDLGTWELSRVRDALRKQSGFTPAEVSAVKSMSDARQLIRSKGYDGVVYENAVEARGSGDSVIALSPTDVKTVGSADMYDREAMRALEDQRPEFHPYMSPEQNDRFRAVHDWLAHAGEGHSFGPTGEENAYRVHASTLSPMAQRALATETRGQNSWVNFGPNAHLPAKERPFAEQKAALWPEGLLGDYDDMSATARLQGAPAIVTPPSQQDVFDPSKLGLDIPAGVTAERPPVKYPARADMSAFDAVIRKFKTHYTPNVEKALKETPEAAGWYDMTQLRDAMDPKDFEQLMLFMGPTSSGTQVPMNIRHASKMFQLWKEDPAKFAEQLRTGSLDLPTGYSNRRQASINSGLSRILETGNLDPFEAPKTFRYANQLAGRMWGGAALDMHVGRQVGRKGQRMTANQGLVSDTGFPLSSEIYKNQKLISGSPQPRHYPVIEDALVKEADRLGLAPAQYQALGWIGGGEKTGVSDTRPLLSLMNEKLRSTTKMFGTGTPQRAWELFSKGEIPLWALAGVSATGLLTDPRGESR